MARGPGKKTIALKFEALVQDGLSPEVLILQVAQGKRELKTKKAKDQYAAALALMPYRMPRLNNIDAVNKNVDMTHEDFIKQQLNEDGE